MRRVMSALIAGAMMMTWQSFALTEKEIQALDGHIVFINDLEGQNGGRNKIQIMDADETDWSKPEAVLWEYELKTGKDGLTLQDHSKYHDAKRVLNEDGKECLLIAGDDRGFALFDLESEQFIFSNKVPDTETHTAELLPGNNFALARTREEGKEIQIWAGIKNDDDKMYDSKSQNRTHDAAWDGTGEVLWMFGTGGMLRFSFDRESRTLEEITPRPARLEHGGIHGLTPKFGSPGIFYANANNYGVVEYDESKDEWREVYPLSAKSVSYNPDRKELLIPDKGGTISHRSHRCITVSEKGELLRTYVMPVPDGTWYKARWFVHNSYAHPEVPTATEHRLAMTKLKWHQNTLRISSQLSGVSVKDILGRSINTENLRLLPKQAVLIAEVP